MRIIEDKNFSSVRYSQETAKDFFKVEQTVSEIINDVKSRGDSALIEYERRFDQVELANLKVSQEEIDVAFAAADIQLIEVYKRAIKNIEAYHSLQKREGFETRPSEGIVLGQKITPIEIAGIYVPGGTASYPSTVLMNAIPAKIAGVKKIIMLTPPQKDGKIKDEILIAAKLAGVTDIFKVGGAQAIAAMAYGTETIPKVDKIVGPGNIYVATAKRMVFGQVSIDMVAGPSEILIVADKLANPIHLAVDLLSQAEHDKLASAILLTDDKSLAIAVSNEVENQLKSLPRREIAEISIQNNGEIILCDSLERAVEISNQIAPEHLELAVSEPEKLLNLVKNAGSVFLGYYSPEALGDYYAGCNHTLPTSGTARFSSALSVDDFIKKTQYMSYSKAELLKVKDDIAAFAESEGLNAHANSVLIRFNEGKNE